MKKKATVKDIQQLCGFLNFLCCAIVPGRAFTRRLYHQTSIPSDSKLKLHHHIKISHETKLDLKIWEIFLHRPEVLSRPFLDVYGTEFTSETLDMYSDASKNPELGLGALCGEEWTYCQWNSTFITEMYPSIEYLELYAVLVAVKLWIHNYKNKRIILFCDNRSVVDMINSNTSSCKNCMVLIQILVLEGILHNVRIGAKHISGKANYFSDALFRLQLKRFWDLASQHNKQFRPEPAELPEDIWPVEKLVEVTNICLTVIYNFCGLLLTGQTTKDWKKRESKMTASTSSSISSRHMELILQDLQLHTTRNSTLHGTPHR